MAPLLPPLAKAYPSLLAVAGGSLAVLGFAPFSLFLVAPVSAALLYFALERASSRAALWRGWLFGLGLLGFGVFWIRISLNEFGNMHVWVAHLVTAIFISGMALYYGLNAWLLRRLDRGSRWVGPLLLFPGLFVIFEWLRGWLFTGFPWLNLGYTQLEGPLAGYAPVIGVYGISLLVVVSGGLLWGLLRWPLRARALAAAGLVIIWGAGAGLKGVDWTQASGPSLRISVLQANIPQAVKWEPGAAVDIAEAYVQLTKEAFDSDVIIWPETALPSFLHQVRAPLLDPLAERARAEGAEIVMGIPVMDLEHGRYYNGLVSIGSAEDLYAKRHLVPFGEFMPFKAWLGPLIELFEVPMSDFSRGDSPRPLLTVGEHRVGASICYEDAFPNEVSEALPEAEYLINVSNDAWFGDSLAPHQHLEISRMRALENGRYLARATNTGVSAIIDDKGALIKTLPSFVRGSATAEIEPRQGLTPYAAVGNWAAIGIALAMVVAGVAFGRYPRLATPQA
ncbi:apolipoprotein N-acyltransferase [Thiorhodococcus mannitoliphagus]|uniref:Apolipoprotein N-acyltransferase n=1 Tax=Thiorhodococcus mannitoliphagus TaxID=329406 RepID=A0A6P1DQM3_9GAMM|nr:apolipoprotein N-acyltransferase [Thiorhodococcus mannitoliphagus]NEX19840.1 apolipoprotein N-acyltransferase [Thiorhodococcus mannitoliphagus]